MLSNQLAELWQESMQDEGFRFELKAQEVAVGLASAVAASGMTQKALADKLGWTTSRVSKVLHGATNLTLKTLFEVCEALNIEFDIAFDREGVRQEEIAVTQLKHQELEAMLQTAEQINKAQWQQSQSSRSIVRQYTYSSPIDLPGMQA
ncbi:helix-turn-helix transcriptional regulator [Denitrificimonas sp. JX-1]|uniref:Helix-turn-helix transcriptional regulator n=1 Tax=Denitrificimonas halotolerans TaxID=3098930 RepID=A0ABU5GRD3_9GAMM|nr:helix-turn-helix transcriptional regulator [Denitrificimonas sp. JX-1]MDY7219404.1 helix-turn-helix transcriptional regulator [Denitrificimonas sp. JX-1]